MRASPASARELSFQSEVMLEHTPPVPVAHPDDKFDPGFGAFPFVYPEEDVPDLLRCIEPQHADPRRRAASAGRRRFIGSAGSTGVVDLLSDMTRAIHREFDYRSRLIGGCQTAAGDAEARRRQLPRLRHADGRGGPLARPRGAFRLRLHPRPSQGRRPCRRRPHPRLGPRLCARAAAGWSSTPPTASSATRT